MNRPILTCVFVVAGTVAFAQQPADQQHPADQQQPAQASPYQGQSNPPADDIIVTPPADQPQPDTDSAAGKPVAQPASPGTDGTIQPKPQAQSGATAQYSTHANPADSSVNDADPDVTGTDDGIVGIAKQEPQDGMAGTQPILRSREESSDPDGDIVHPHPLGPDELADGTTIRVHLLTPLSSVDSQPGEVFRTQVATDVLQDGHVLIPAGAEIDGRVVQVAAGTVSSHGTMLLRPDTVILADGSRFHMDAQLSGAPGTGARISGEGYLDPASRFKKDTVKYGAGVGGGAVTGAMIAGPAGAIAGSLIGAGAITVHLLTSHSNAVLQPGTVLLFTLDSRLDLRSSANSTAN